MSIVERLITVYDAKQTIAVAFEQVAEVEAPFAVSVLEDNFNEASTTWLENHTPDFGGPWTWNTDSDWSSAGAWNLQINAGSSQVGLRGSSTHAGEYAPVNSVADLDITAIIENNHTSSGQGLVFFRSIRQQVTGYSFGFRNGDNISLDHWTNGTPTNLYLDSDVGVGALTMRIQMIGTTLKFWVTDILDSHTPVFDDTDATFAGPDYVHVYCEGFSAHWINYLKVSEYS